MLFGFMAKKEDRISQLKETVEGLKKAQSLLNERHEKKQISNEEYMKRIVKISNDLEKYEKKLRSIEK